MINKLKEREAELKECLKGMEHGLTGYRNARQYANDKAAKSRVIRELQRVQSQIQEEEKDGS